MKFTLFFLGCLFFFGFISLKIIKAVRKYFTPPVSEKEIQSEADPEPFFEDDLPPDFEGEKTSPLEEFSGKTAKSEDIFTYDSLSTLEEASVSESEVFSKEYVEKPTQPVENKEENKSPISLDLNDIKKGIIYSEILKRRNY